MDRRPRLRRLWLKKICCPPVAVGPRRAGVRGGALATSQRQACNVRQRALPAEVQASTTWPVRTATGCAARARALRWPPIRSRSQQLRPKTKRELLVLFSRPAARPRQHLALVRHLLRTGTNRRSAQCVGACGRAEHGARSALGQAILCSREALGGGGSRGRVLEAVRAARASRGARERSGVRSRGARGGCGGCAPCTRALKLLAAPWRESGWRRGRALSTDFDEIDEREIAIRAHLRTENSLLVVGRFHFSCAGVSIRIVNVPSRHVERFRP